MCSTARKCGSPTRRLPIWRWYGPSWMARYAASSVERGTPGFDTPKIEGKLSLRASVTGSISLNDAKVPESAILPNVKGLRGPFSLPQQGRATALPGARWGRSRVLLSTPPREYALERVVFGKPIAATQLVQKKSSPTCRPRSRSAFVAALQLGRLLDEGAWVPRSISMLKRNNCGKALTHRPRGA